MVHLECKKTSAANYYKMLQYLLSYCFDGQNKTEIKACFATLQAFSQVLVKCIRKVAKAASELV